MLTDAKDRAAKPRGKSDKLIDANRLHLLVTFGGGKLWRWNYEDDGKHTTETQWAKVDAADSLYGVSSRNGDCVSRHAGRWVARPVVLSERLAKKAR